MLDGRAEAVVLPIDWATFGAAHAARPVALANDLLLEQASSPADGEAGATPTLAARFGEVDEDERADLVTSVVRHAVGRVLRLPESRIDDRQPFGGLGLDSLMAIELRNSLETEVGFKLSATMAWNYPTVADLSAHVLSRLGGAGRADIDGDDADRVGDLDSVAASPTGDDVDTLAAAVADLDDDDALRALMGRGSS
jgi:myxalamid-type polyketide synthase MxaE and MxaD